MFFKREKQQSCEEGCVVEVVRERKEWRVLVYGVYWFAKANGKLNCQPGDIVRIVGRQGTKLIIDSAGTES